MSQPSATELERLQATAFEVREVFGARGHAVAMAVDMDPAFANSNRPSSSLARELVLEGAKRGWLSNPGVGLIACPGGGLDLASTDGNVYKKYRVKKARALGDGQYEVLGDPALFDLDGDVLLREERWVFGVTLGDGYMIDTIFAAPVVGIQGEKPGRLLLGKVTVLGESAISPQRGFTSTREELDGFEAPDHGVGNANTGSA